jgi:2-polyprenyl-3-methyl-5-hydroxy-6-metoxy-1,4-benzoquinol methylase
LFFLIGFRFQKIFLTVCLGNLQMNDFLPVDMEQPVCLVCGSNSRRPFLTVDNRFNVSQKFHLVQCQDCGFVYLSPRPEEKSITQYYQDSGYQPHQKEALSLSGKLYQLVRIWNNHYKRRLIEKFSAKGKILDYGCGTGEFLLEMKNSGWETYGFEPTASAVAIAVDYGLNIIPDLRSIKEKVNVVTLWHVLEHVHDARTLLVDLQKILDPAGLLCIALPNRRSLDAVLFKQNWVAYDVPRHLYHFSAADLEKFLNSEGFKIESIKSLPFDPWYNSFLSASLEFRNSRLKLLGIGLPKSIFAAAAVNFLSFLSKKNNSSIIYLARFKSGN